MSPNTPKGHFSLQNRAFFKLSGPDAERYLNGQITNDVRSASTEHSIYALVTNAKAKLQGELYLHRIHQTEFLCDLPIELRESLFARLDQYLIADDALLEDVTEQYHIVHYIGEIPTASGNQFVRKTNRLGIDGFDLIAISPTLTIDDTISINERDRLRISNLIPAWSYELSEDLLPQEAGLEHRAISFNKGCYVGQEVISRIKSIGRVNRSLTKFHLTWHDNYDSHCLPLSITLEDGTNLGILTSVTDSADPGQLIGLGFLHRKADDKNEFYIMDLKTNKKLGLAIRAHECDASV